LIFVAICSVESGLKRKWPKNLSVKYLEIIGPLNEKDMENLSSIQCEHLNLQCISAQHMYNLVEMESMGQFVKILRIGNRRAYYRLYFAYDDGSIILERILAACPNLENFQFNTERNVVRDRKYDLPPSAFKNYKE
jgi:hypothetical protein